MTETVILGESGRIVLPASIRKEFGMAPGERLTVIERTWRDQDSYPQDGVGEHPGRNH